MANNNNNKTQNKTRSNERRNSACTSNGNLFLFDAVFNVAFLSRRSGSVGMTGDRRRRLITHNFHAAHVQTRNNFRIFVFILLRALDCLFMCATVHVRYLSLIRLHRFLNERVGEKNQRTITRA